VICEGLIVFKATVDLVQCYCINFRDNCGNSNIRLGELTVIQITIW